MSEDPDIPVRQWLADELRKQGHGAKGKLAEFLGISGTQLGRMLPGSAEPRRIEAGLLLRMQQYFGSSPGGDVTVPIMGYLGAGAEIEPEFEQVPPEGLDSVVLPFQVPGDLVAFKVRGVSMLPVYREASIVLVYREQRRPLESFYGEEAAVRTADGKRFIKTIMRGRQGTVTLTSWNANPIEDQRLEWIGEIFAVLPPFGPRSAIRPESIRQQSTDDIIEPRLRDELDALVDGRPDLLPRVRDMVRHLLERERRSSSSSKSGNEPSGPGDAVPQQRGRRTSR